MRARLIDFLPSLSKQIFPLIVFARRCDNRHVRNQYDYGREQALLEFAVDPFTQAAMIQSLKQSWFLAPARLQRLWWVLAALSLVNALLEMIAAVAMVVLVAYLAGRAMPKLPGGAIIRLATSSLQSVDGLRWLCFGLAAIFTAKYLVGTTLVMLQIRLPLAAGNDLVGRLFRLYLSAPYEFHVQRNSAETIRNLSASIEVLYRVVAPSALSLLSESVSISAIVALLMFSAPNETMIVGFIALASLLILYRFFHRRLLIWGQQVHNLSRDGLMHARQSLDGIKDIRVAGVEHFFWQRYMDIRTTLTRTLVRQAQLQQIPKFLLEGGFIALVLITIVVFSYRSNYTDTLPLLGLFAYAGLRILPSVGRILISVQLIRSAGPAAANVYADFVNLSSTAVAPIPPCSAVRERPLDAAIEIDHVTFRYEGATEPVLRDISVKIRHGQVVGFVGSSGAGKSTLVNVLLGLLSPQTGKIRLNGIDIRNDLREWQSRIGYVPQSTFILDDTLCRNVAFGIPDDQIDMVRVWHALKKAQLTELTDGLVNGLHTRLGEHGARLSGGERQRVAIARALYNNPAILVFDEATSGIDTVTERYITDVIERMRGNHTVIIITHQLSLTRRCDNIILLHDGRIVGSGTFAELHRDYEEFRALVEERQRDGAVSTVSGNPTTNFLSAG